MSAAAYIVDAGYQSARGGLDRGYIEAETPGCCCCCCCCCCDCGCGRGCGCGFGCCCGCGCRCCRSCCCCRCCRCCYGSCRWCSSWFWCFLQQEFREPELSFSSVFPFTCWYTTWGISKPSRNQPWQSKLVVVVLFFIYLLYTYE